MPRNVLAGLAGAAATVLAVPSAAPAREAPDSRPLRALLAAKPWLNGPPLKAQDLRGKVVLVNFWTYSCINSLRPLPYVRAWAEKYRDRGLVVIGVHTPEFGFETDAGNIGRAMASLDVRYPVAADSDYGVWRAFENQAWPAFYFIGADGRVRKQVLGEGGYDASERLIQALLAETGSAPVPGGLVSVAGKGPQAAPDWRNLRSPETYVGYAQATGFVSPGGLKRDVASAYRTLPPPLNHWSLEGSWKVGGEFAGLAGPTGALAYRFHARDLNLVMAPASRARPIRFRVTLDGAPPGDDHGYDTDAQGWGSLDEPRMYQLVRQGRRVADRTFRIEFTEPGARAYVFTFG